MANSCFSSSIRSFFVSSQEPLEAGAGAFPDVVGHAVIDERVEALGDHPLAVDDRTDVPDLVGIVPRTAMPDLVVEPIYVALLGKKGHRFPVFEGRILAVIRVSAGIVAAGDDLGQGRIPRSRPG